LVVGVLLLGIDRNQLFEHMLRGLTFVHIDTYTSKKTKDTPVLLSREKGEKENKGCPSALWQSLSPQRFCSVTLLAALDSGQRGRQQHLWHRKAQLA